MKRKQPEASTSKAVAPLKAPPIFDLASSDSDEKVGTTESESDDEPAPPPKKKAKKQAAQVTPSKPVT